MSDLYEVVFPSFLGDLCWLLREDINLPFMQIMIITLSPLLDYNKMEVFLNRKSVYKNKTFDLALFSRQTKIEC